MNNIEDKILQKIKNEKLHPKPIWYFLARDYSLWSLVFISVLLAGLSIAPIIFIGTNVEWSYIKHINSNPYLFILYILPYPWIILCIITTYFAKLSWTKTKSGYKFQGKYIIIISILSSLILGIILNLYSLGKNIDDRFHDQFAIYKNVETRKQENWFNPTEGRFIGIIKNISTSTFILFNERANMELLVFYDPSVPGYEFLEENNKLRVIGYGNNGEPFIACAIFPDNLLRPKERVDAREKIKEKIEARFVAHPECKDIVEIGRANFKPSIVR